MYTGFDSSPALRHWPLAPILVIPEDNSLNNLDALRGVFGARPGPGSLQTSLARHSLSMRKSCLESYRLELHKELNLVLLECIIEKHPVVLTTGCLAF